jgi:hypothetical protein
VKRAGLLLILCAAMLAAQSLGPSTEQYVTVASPKKVEVASGRPGTLELDFRVKQGMHVNSNTPHSEFLIPTKLSFNPPTDLMISKITYPQGEELGLSFSPKDKLSVYTGDFHISAQVSASHAATTGPYTLHGELKYQACNDKSCFPPKTLPIVAQIQVGKPKKGADGVMQDKPTGTKTQRNPAQSPHIHK